MINKLEQLQNFQDSVESRDALDRLRALQYMQAQSQGLMGLPVVQRSVGGGAGAGGAGGGGAAANPGFIPRQPAYGGRGLPSAPIRQNIPQEVIQQPEENVVNIPIAAQGNLELNTASITPTEITPQMMAAPEAPIEAIGPTGQELPQPTGLASMGESGFSPLRAAKEGGPIVHRFSTGKVFPQLIEQVKKDQPAGVFSSQAQVLPTPQVVPEAGPQVQQAPSVSTLADVNTDALSRHGEGSTFKYGDQHYEATSGGPLAIHTLTEEGMRNRAIRGGLMDWDQRANTGIDYAPDRHTLSEADMFRTPRGYGPSPVIGEEMVPQPINPPTAITRSELPGYGTELNWTDPYGNATMAPTHDGPYAVENIQPERPSDFIDMPRTRTDYSEPFIGKEPPKESIELSDFLPVEIMNAPNQPQVIPPLSGPNIQGFKSKELAMTHARENPNQQQGLVNVYQLPDGSWDYQKVARGGTPMGMPVTPGGPAIGASPPVAGLMMMRRNPETGNWERYSDPRIARAGGGQIAEAAQGLESLGRKGDEILVHMSPDELQGLESLGNITYNPITGLPEAWGFKSIFKAVRKLAPIALAIAAPYAFGATTALGIGAATAGGSFLGNIIAGAKPKDALKAGLMSGLFAGGGAYLGGASSGFGGLTGGGGGTAAAGTAGTVGSGYGGLTGGASGIGGAGGGYAGTAGSSALGAGISGQPAAMGAGGFGAGGAGGVGPLSSQFSMPTSPSGMPSYGGASKLGRGAPMRLAQQPVQPVQTGTTVYGEGGTTFTPDIQAQPVQIRSPAEMQADQFGQTQVYGPEAADMSQVVPTEVSPEMARLSEAQLGTKPPSFVEDPSWASAKQMGKDIYKDYGTWKGAAKLVAMDLGTPDWEAQYAAEAAAKNKQLEAAGYTVDTGFDGQTVIRDSSGTVMPRNLTVQQILDRALGKTPRTRLVERYDYAPATAKQGGLISLAGGGEFSGRVEGRGHGMEDNVYMPIKDKGEQIGTLAVSPAEYVVDAHTMSALGNGNANQGAKVMDGVVESVRKKAYGTIRQPKEIDGLKALKPLMERI